jgi:hypothetical protein
VLHGDSHLEHPGERRLKQWRKGTPWTPSHNWLLALAVVKWACACFVCWLSVPPVFRHTSSRDELLRGRDTSQTNEEGIRMEPVASDRIDVSRRKLLGKGGKQNEVSALQSRQYRSILQESLDPGANDHLTIHE